jgi:hypothetical protein
MCLEGCLALIFLCYPNIVVSPPDIKLGEESLSMQPFNRGVQSCTYFLLIGLLIGLLICHLLDKENFKESDKDENDQD